MRTIINKEFALVRNVFVEDILFDIDTLSIERFKVKYKIPVRVEVEIDFTDLEDEEQDEFLTMAIKEAGLGSDYIQDYRKQTQEEEWV